MKRSHDGSSYPAMLSFQSFKAGERLFVTDDAGDLSPTGCVGGLALSAGLCFRHGSGRVSERSGFGGGDFHAIAGGIAGNLEHGGIRSDVGQSVNLREGITGAGENGIQHGSVSREGGNLIRETLAGGEGLHGWLRLTVGPSYIVTSDNATTVRRETVGIMRGGL